jgi:hypothetical protein
MNNLDLNTITVDIIHTKYKAQYLFSYVDIIKYSIDVTNLILCNLLYLLDKSGWFIYYNNSNLTEQNMEDLFTINKSGILTCCLFNEPVNKYKMYGRECANLDDDIDTREQKKKFMSCYINNNELENILTKLNMYFNNNKFIIILENEIKQKNNVETQSTDLDKYTLSYDLNNGPRDNIVCNYLSLQKKLDMFNPIIKTELIENYTFVVLIENELETKTDIIELFTNAIFDM